MIDQPYGPIQDPRVNAVIARLQGVRQRPSGGGPRSSFNSRDPHAYAEQGFSIHPEQGELIYLLCRGLRATRVAEFATSVGMSTLYFAAAVRDNGGGTVIGSEIVPAKVEAAKRNVAEAGLADYAEIREGDARKRPDGEGGVKFHHGSAASISRVAASRVAATGGAPRSGNPAKTHGCEAYLVRFWAEIWHRRSPYRAAHRLRRTHPNKRRFHTP